MKMGDLWREEVKRDSKEVRATVVAKKSGNPDRAKGGREANAFTKWDWKRTPAIVPKVDKQAGKAPKYGAQPRIWSEGMLVALERGIKGNKWFSLIDKVYEERTLELAGEKSTHQCRGMWR